MRVYIDSEYRCHTESADGLREFDVAALDGKCRTYADGMRYVPQGEYWVRDDGTRFFGEMLAPWRDSKQIEAAQAEYEAAQIVINELETAMAVAMDEAEQTISTLDEAIIELEYQNVINELGLEE